MEKTVLLEIDGPIALIMLNRPERQNSICQDLLINLYNAIDEVAHNSDIKVAILIGNGKSFCSSIDLSVIGKDNLLDPQGDGKDMPYVFASCNKPIIGGFELAVHCDFLIVSDNARFIDSHTKVGIHPG